jgi:hypothetical protein
MLKEGDAQIKETSNRGRKVTKGPKPSMPDKTANINLILESFGKNSQAEKKLKNTQGNQKLESVGAFILFIITTGISIAYYATFRTYHAALTKMDSLKTILANPNARVAAGETGKSILSRIQAS